MPPVLFHLTIALALCGVLCLPIVWAGGRMHLDVASISRIAGGPGGARLLGFNATAHLDGT